MRRISSHRSRRAAWRGAAVLAVVLTACGDGGAQDAIPVGKSDEELVVVTQQLESAFASTTLKAASGSKKDDGSTGWDHRFEEQVDPPAGGVVRRRFRATITNRSDAVRSIRLEIDYREPGTATLVRRRSLRTVVVPPFTETAISGFTKFRETRDVVAELRATEVRPE